MLPLSGRAKVLNEARKRRCAKVAKTYGKNGSSIRETVKTGKEIRAGFAVTPPTAPVTAEWAISAQVRRKRLSLWVEDASWTCALPESEP